MNLDFRAVRESFLLLTDIEKLNYCMIKIYSEVFNINFSKKFA